jgi:hypothetical protein
LIKQRLVSSNSDTQPIQFKIWYNLFAFSFIFLSLVITLPSITVVIVDKLSFTFHYRLKDKKEQHLSL